MCLLGTNFSTNELANAWCEGATQLVTMRYGKRKL